MAETAAGASGRKRGGSIETQMGDEERPLIRSAAL
jgi:hypothetical protein